MAEGGRHLNGNNTNDIHSGNTGSDDFQWPDLDWLEEIPEPRPRRQQSGQGSAGQQPSRQRPAQSRQQADWQQEQQPRRAQPSRQGGEPQGRAQRPAQSGGQPRQGGGQRPAKGQQRPAPSRQGQQRPPQQRQGQGQQSRQGQQRPPQSRQGQQRPPQQRPAPSRQARYVEVEPEEYRPKRRSRSSLPLILLIVVLVGGILVAGVKLGSALLNYQRDRSAYDALADEALAGLAEPNATHDPNEQTDVTEQQQTQSEAPFALNWDYLRSVNSDVVGWLYCADTRINYPVVQYSDNDYYLHRDFTTKEPNTVGTLYVDYNATLGVNLSNFLIYGHNMKDGTMFATLRKYVDQDYYVQHPVMYFLTPTQNYRIDLIAARIVEANQENYPTYFLDSGAYANYQNTITSSSFFTTQASVSTDYQLVSLSTCDYSGGYSNPRFLVQGLLVPIT